MIKNKKEKGKNHVFTVFILRNVMRDNDIYQLTIDNDLNKGIMHAYFT